MFLFSKSFEDIDSSFISLQRLALSVPVADERGELFGKRGGIFVTAGHGRGERAELIFDLSLDVRKGIIAHRVGIAHGLKDLLAGGLCFGRRGTGKETLRVDRQALDKRGPRLDLGVDIRHDLRRGLRFDRRDGRKGKHQQAHDGRDPCGAAGDKHQHGAENGHHDETAVAHTDEGDVIEQLFEVFRFECYIRADEVADERGEYEAPRDPEARVVDDREARYHGAHKEHDRVEHREHNDPDDGIHIKTLFHFSTLSIRL